MNRKSAVDLHAGQIILNCGFRDERFQAEILAGTAPSENRGLVRISPTKSVAPLEKQRVFAGIPVAPDENSGFALRARRWRQQPDHRFQKS
jgi:hypothetical protein